MLSKPDISIFLGGIRPQLWRAYYNSILQSIGKYKFELVICGPYQPLIDMVGISNFRFIRDFGSVSRGAQIAAMFSEGELITLGADDGLYYPELLSEAIDLYKSINIDKKIVSLRYGEGGNLHEESYWNLWNWQHFRLKSIPTNTPMCLNNIVSRKYFEEMGGYNCELFNTCNWGGQDLSIRYIKDGATFIPFKKHIMMCSWGPTPEGLYNDHLPVYAVDDMQKRNQDYDRFINLYKQDLQPIRIDFNNWTKSETIWSERFP